MTARVPPALAISDVSRGFSRTPPIEQKHLKDLIQFHMLGPIFSVLRIYIMMKTYIYLIIISYEFIFTISAYSFRKEQHTLCGNVAC